MLPFLCSADGGAVQAGGPGAAACYREDTEGMNRGRAETHLRQLAEGELRRATAPGALSLGPAGTLPLVAQALIAVGAVDVGTADQIQAELDVALAARYQAAGMTPQALARLHGVRPPRAVTGTVTASRQPPWQVVPAGQVIRIRDDEIHGELGLLAYLQTAQGGRFTAAGWMHGPAPGPSAQPPRPHLLVSRQFTAADDKGTSYTLRFSFMTGITGSAVWAGVLDLRPDPPHQIGWLDLRTAPGEPATRIRLDPRDPQIPAPEVTVTRTAHSPGELLLDVIAARILTSAGARPQDNPGQLASAELRAFVGDGPGHIVAALQAADALPRSSPAPGQLAGLCARLGIPGHGITVPPAADLPERWLSMLTRDHRRKPDVTPAPGSWAATAAGLPELDGVQARRPRPAPSRARHHRAPARGRRADGGRLGVPPGRQAPAHLVDPRPRRPLARHQPLRPQIAGRGRRGHPGAGDRPAAGGGHPADRPGGRRAIGPGPGQAATQLDVESMTAT